MTSDNTGKDDSSADGYAVVAVVFFGKKTVAVFPTREQAERRARESNEHAERNPRGFVSYVVRRHRG